MEFWSDPIAGEIRDDQGISLHNPDTDVFMEYTLAGAYDSNVALLLTVGGARETAYEQMAEVLRSTRLRGRDLQTNLAFHYGLVHWFLGRTVNARPTTRFIVPYLTAVGELAQEAGRVDIKIAWEQLCATLESLQQAPRVPLCKSVLAAKESLLIRPITAANGIPSFALWLAQSESTRLSI